MRYESRLLVNFSNLEYNLKNLKAKAPQNEVLFMIKADAYGHGLEEVYEFAAMELGIKKFGVASLKEGVILREKYHHLKTDIYIFSDLNLSLSNSQDVYEKFNLIPVLASLDDVKCFMQWSSKVPLVIKFNTGMNRIGLEYNNLEALIKLLKENKVTTIHHIMTHFASSYFKVKDDDSTYRQYQLFKTIKDELRGAGITYSHSSCANSGAIEQEFALAEDIIRPGLMLYGPYSIGALGKDDKVWNARNLSQFETHITRLDIRKKGTPLGYGGSILDKDYLVMTLPIGYGDGFLTYYSGANLKISEQDCRVLGRINMDMIQLGFDPDLENKFKVNERVALWSFGQDSIMKFSKSVKTIPYQVLTAVSKRIPREYIRE
jgi:alanine racemase